MDPYHDICPKIPIVLRWFLTFTTSIVPSILKDKTALTFYTNGDDPPEIINPVCGMVILLWYVKSYLVRTCTK